MKGLYTKKDFIVGELVMYTREFKSDGYGDLKGIAVITKKYKNSQYLQIMSVETGMKYSTTAGWIRKV